MLKSSNEVERSDGKNREAMAYYRLHIHVYP